MDEPVRLVVAAALVLGPPTLVELWWRQRCRREDERLLVSPTDKHDMTRT
jgi:hypothetical protein